MFREVKKTVLAGLVGAWLFVAPINAQQGYCLVWYPYTLGAECHQFFGDGCAWCYFEGQLIGSMCSYIEDEHYYDAVCSEG